MYKPRSGERRGGAQALGVDVDDQGGEQDQAADQDLEEAVDVDVVEAVIEHAEHEEPDDGVRNAALAAEQAGAADHHRGDRIEQVVVELVLLGAAEMGDAEHAGDARADRRDDHDGGDDGAHVDAGILRRLAVAADHVDVAPEARIGQHDMAAGEHDGGDDDEPRHRPERAAAKPIDQGRDGIGDLAAHQHGADPGADLEHGQGHDEGGDADLRDAEGGDGAEEKAARQRQHDGERAGKRQVGDVDAGILEGEEGDDDAGRVGDGGDAEIDLGAQDDEGEADGDHRGDRDLR